MAKNNSTLLMGVSMSLTKIPQNSCTFIHIKMELEIINDIDMMFMELIGW